MDDFLQRKQDHPLLAAIEVEAEGNIMPFLETKVENGELKIYLKKSINTTNGQTVRITMPQIETLTSSSAATIKSSKIKGKRLTIIASSASQIDVIAEYEDIEIKASSSSEVTIAGKALKLKASSSSASKIEADKLLVNDAIVDASSAGKITTQPLENLDAEASSAGEVIFTSSPKNIKKEETSGGSISKK